jgi:hypothetical protein
MEVSGQVHDPAALPSRETAHGTRRIGDWVGQRRFGCYEEEKNLLFLPRIGPQIFDRPARKAQLDGAWLGSFRVITDVIDKE